MSFTGTTFQALTLRHLTIAAACITGGLTATLTATAAAPFTEEAVARGVTYAVAPTDQFGDDLIGIGALFADLDNDGDPDLITIGAADDSIGVFENDGTGNFTDRFLTSGIPFINNASGIISADYDGDGDLDLFFCNMFAANVLMRNDGGFTFTDVTATAGVGGDPTGATVGSAWGDFDNDGWVDLYVANYYALNIASGGTTTEENLLYRNQGDGTFVDVAAALGVQDANSPTLQALFFDHDLDGDADLYLSTDKGNLPAFQNYLFENQGGTFVDITPTAGVAAYYNSMGVGVGDFDGNGLQDLYPTNIPAGNDLYLNQGAGVFTEEADFCGVRSYRIGWAAHFFDYDNSGTMDLFVCNMNTENRLYVNAGVFPVIDEAPALNVDTLGLSFGLAVADIDNDGDLDLALPNVGEPVRLLINNEGQTRQWVKFNVVGENANTHAIGAIVTVRVGLVDRIREILAGGNSYKSQNELTLHFGLDTATVTDQIDILWPGGATRTLTGYTSGTTWTLYPTARLGDDNDDGVVDLTDFVAFVQAYHQPTFAPGAEVMDLDGDADVDGADYTEFLARYTGPLDDCNNNAVSDLDEILNNPALDADLDGLIDSCPPPGPGGDLNGDCVVDTADLGLLLGAFGTVGPTGDINGDGTVDTADLGLLLGQFGDSCI